MIFRAALVLGLLLCVVVTQISQAQEDRSLTPESLRAALARNISGDEATRLAEKVRAWFGRENLVKGARPKINGLNVSFAIEVPGQVKPAQVVSQDGAFRLPLVRLGTTDVYAASTSLPDGTAMRWVYDVGGQKLGGGELEVYGIHPDSVEKSGVSNGAVILQPKLRSKIFPDTECD